MGVVDCKVWVVDGKVWVVGVSNSAVGLGGIEKMQCGPMQVYLKVT